MMQFRLAPSAWLHHPVDRSNLPLLVSARLASKQLDAGTAAPAVVDNFVRCGLDASTDGD